MYSYTYIDCVTIKKYTNLVKIGHNTTQKDDLSVLNQPTVPVYVRWMEFCVEMLSFFPLMPLNLCRATLLSTEKRQLCLFLTTEKN